MTFKTFRSKNFKKHSKRGKNFDVLPPFDIEVSEEQADTELTELTRRIGDEKIAKRVQALKQQYPNGTIPELITMDWLQANQYRYIYQGMLFGGRAMSGGLVPDFVVDTGGGTGAAWQVQGEYWHAKDAQKQVSDTENNLRMLGQVIGGIRIDKVILLWESDIYRKNPLVFQLAISGINLR